ncbi:hypothetical protein HHI36_015890, partial [Cryptolaemus montrouzieri]
MKFTLLIAYLFTILVHTTCDLLDDYVKHVEIVNEIDSNRQEQTFKSEGFSDFDFDTANRVNFPRNRRRKRHAYQSEPVDQWTHSEILDKDGAVVLKWQPRHQEILFRVEARTRGYVGIGFSPNGGMEDADIVIGWVDDRTGKAFLY